MPVPIPNPSRSFKWEALILILVTLAAYAPGFWNGFVYDDENYILNNPAVNGPFNPRLVFLDTYPPGAGDQGLYRPLVTVSFWLDGKIWGFARPGNWNGFHLTNALIHALNAFLFLGLLRFLGLGGLTRFFSALLFAVHPVFSEDVAWSVGRAELLGMTFGLLALLAFFRAPQSKSGWMSAFSLWILSLLCKEHWILLPFLAALVCFSMPNAPGWDFKKAWKPASWAFVALALFWGFRFRVIGSWHPPISAYGSVSHFSRIATALRVLWMYVGLWFWPAGLSIHHEIRIIPGLFPGLALAAGWALVFWLTVRIHRLFPWFTLAVGWFWISILPVSNLLVTIGAVSGERFLYLPTLFFAPALVLGARKAIQVGLNVRHQKPAALSIACAVCLLFSGRLWLRLDDWRSNLTLWEAASRNDPESYGIKALLSSALMRDFRFSEAHVLASEAMDQAEKNPQPYQKYFSRRLIQIDAQAQSGMQKLAWARKMIAANELAKNSRNKEALAAYEALIQDDPEEPRTHEALGDLYVRLKNPMGARQQYDAALRLPLGPTPELWGKEGQVLSELGFKAEALMAYDQSIQSGPHDPFVPGTWYNRGLVLAELGDFTASLDSFEKSIELAPKYIEPRLNRVSLLIHLKRFEEAARELSQVLKLDPKRQEALELLAKLPKSNEQNR